MNPNRPNPLSTRGDIRHSRRMNRISGLRPASFLVCVLTLAVSMSSATARAQSVDVCVNEMSDEQIEMNTNRIIRELRDHQRHARAWRFGWLVAYAGLTGLYSYRAAIADKTPGPDRAAFLGHVGVAAGAAYATARLAFYPMPDIWGPRRIERMPTETRAQRVEQLRYADDVVRRAGQWQHLFTGLTSWGFSFAWGAGWGGTLMRNDADPIDAAFAFLGAPILGTASILTAPNWAEQWRASFVSSMCTGVYVENVEDPLGDEYDEEEIEDDWEPPVDLDDEPPPPPADPEVTVFPTLGGAHLIVAFN